MLFPLLDTQDLKWTREELQQIDMRTRKLMTKHKALHSRVDIDMLYVSRKEEGRRLTIIDGSVDALTQRLEVYLKKN